MIRAQTKRVVRSIYVMRCGYCGVTEAETGAELTYDHFQPQSKGGSDNQENIVYACHACNEFKGDYFGQDETRLLHPLRDAMHLHLRQEADGSLLALSPLGEVSIRVLQLNRPPLVLSRKNTAKQEAVMSNYENLYRNIDRIAERVKRIEERLNPRRRNPH